MHERVKQEIEMLKQSYPLLQHGDQLNWVLIPDFKLPPDRFNKTSTKILFTIPPGYPNTGPDNFFVDGDLRLKDGNKAPAFNEGSQSSSGPALMAGEWGWFSWHPQGWTPAATVEKGDNLVTFVKSINMCLRGEEAQ
jgi:hypothetical protein